MSLVNKALADPMGTADPDLAAAPPNRRRIATNFITLAGTSVLGLIVTILISIYVRRALGPAAIDLAQPIINSGVQQFDQIALHAR